MLPTSTHPPLGIPASSVATNQPTSGESNSASLLRQGRGIGRVGGRRLNRTARAGPTGSVFSRRQSSRMSWCNGLSSSVGGNGGCSRLRERAHLRFCSLAWSRVAEETSAPAGGRRSEHRGRRAAAAADPPHLRARRPTDMSGCPTPSCGRRRGKRPDPLPASRPSLRLAARRASRSWTPINRYALVDANQPVRARGRKSTGMI